MSFVDMEKNDQPKPVWISSLNIYKKGQNRFKKIKHNQSNLFHNTKF